MYRTAPASQPMAFRVEGHVIVPVLMGVVIGWMGV